MFDIYLTIIEQQNKVTFPYTKLLGLIVIVPLNRQYYAVWYFACSVFFVATWEQDVVYEIKTGMVGFVATIH